MIVSELAVNCLLSISNYSFFFVSLLTNKIAMSRIEREKRTVSMMIALYCRHKLGLSELPEEYRALEEYAHRRLDGCKFGNDKPQCKRCTIHCYKPDMRERIREVMRWAGPRMMIYNPIAAIRHLLGK